MDDIDRPPQIVRWTLRLEQASALDRPVHALEPLTKSVFGRGPWASALRGEWLGHAVHPVLTDVAVGTWLSASVLDLFAGPQASPAASGWLLLVCSALRRPPGPAGPSGRDSVRRTSGLASCTQSPTAPRSASTQRRGSPAAGTGVAPASGLPWPEPPWQGRVPTWAATSPRAAGWRATTRRTTPRPDACAPAVLRQPNRPPARHRRGRRLWVDQT